MKWTSADVVTRPCALPSCHRYFEVFADSHQRYCSPRCGNKARSRPIAVPPPAALPGTFGALLREYREARRRSGNSLAIEAGVSPSYIVRLEQGGREPPRRHVVDGLARALRLTGVEAGALFVSAGYSPPGLTEWDPVFQAVAEVLSDNRLSIAERAEFAELVRLAAARWRPSLNSLVRELVSSDVGRDASAHLGATGRAS